MRKFFAVLFLLAAATARGQQATWYPWPNAWVPWIQTPSVVVNAVYDEGTLLTPGQPGINFIGAGITCVTNIGAQRVDCTVGNGTTIATDPIWTAKGQLAVGTGTGTAQVLNAGANGSLLVTDSTQTTGQKYLAPPGVGGRSVYTQDGTNPVWQDPILDPKRAVFADEHFCGTRTFSTNTFGSGTVGNSTSSDVNHPCTQLISTLAAASTGAAPTWENNAGAGSNITSWGRGQIDLMFIGQINSIGDGTDVIKYTIGFCNQIATATECTNGIYLLYDRANSTTNWFLVAAKASVYTRTDTGIAVTTGSMVTYTLQLNAAGTSLTCTIGGVACATPVSTNIPTAGAAVEVKADKTAGATTVFTLNMNRMVAVQNGLTR